MTNQTPYDFSLTLGELDAGVFIAKLSTAVRDVAAGTIANGRKGKVVVELAFEQSGDSNQVLLKHTLKYLRPTRRGEATEKDTTSTPLWVGRRGLSVLPDTQDQFQFNPTEEAR